MENKITNFGNKRNNFGNKKMNFGNRKTNFGNRRINQFQNPIQNQTQTILPSVSPQYTSESNNSNIITIIILLIIFIIIVYVIYVYGEKIYNYFNNLLMGHSDYILLENDESKKEKIKCKSGCVKGKCETKDLKDGCKEDDECNLCVDNQGGFYGNVSNTKENEKKLKEAEEEDIIQNKRIMELEEMIKARNKQIDDLNKYIDYLNKNKDKINKEKIKEIIPEEEDKKFMIKKNYS